MSCPHRDLHLQAGLSEAQQAALVAHARECAECARRRATLDRARAVMQSKLPELDSVTASRWLAHAKGDRKPTWSWTLPVAVTAAVAAAVFAFVSLRPAADVSAVEPEVAVAELRANEMIQTQTARWIALSDFRLARLPSTDAEVMRIEGGHLEIELLDPARTAVVQTHAGVIELEGGQYELRVDEQGALLSINRGQAALRRGADARRFGANTVVNLKAGQWPPRAQTKTVSEETESVPTKTPPVDRPQRSKPPARLGRKQLTEARALLGQDDHKAVALAEAVIARNPQTAPIEASMIAADGYRRRGEAHKAEALYLRVAEHPEGTQFADEALTRRAVSLAERGEDASALEALTQAHLRFADTGLAPERAALTARIQLRTNQISAAADTLMRLQNRRDRILNEPRLKTAAGLDVADPRRAHLLQSVMQGGGPRAARARELLRPAKKVQ